MGFLANLKAIHDRQVAAAEARTRRQIAEARTRTAREKAKLALKRQKYALDKQLADARVATQRAKAEADKARRDSGYVPLSEKIGRFGAGFGRDAARAYKALTTPDKPRRRTTTKRRTTRR